jgi:hypothetical protein
LTRLLCLAAGLVFAAQAAHAAPQPGDPCQFDTVCRFLDQNIGITKTPVTLARLRSVAHVEDEQVTPVKNLHDGAKTDAIHDFRYAGMTVRAYVSAAGQVLVQRIAITGGQHALPLKLAFGESTFDDVEHAIGLPKDVEHLPGGASRWRYVNTEGTASCVFEFEPEPSMRITRVEWNFEVD